MKKVRIIALRQDRKRVLEHLQDSALVQVTNSGDKASDGFERLDTTAQLAAMGAAVLLAAATYLGVLRLLCPSAVHELIGSLRRRKRQ